MSPEQFLKEFGHLAETEGGIQQLRTLILELAVLGKLCPQTASDGTAQSFLDECAVTQARLEEAGVFKRAKAVPDPAEGQMQLPVPPTWRWIQLGNLFRFIDYRGRTPTKVNQGVRLVTAKNVRMGHVSLDPQEFIRQADYDGWMTRGLPVKGDLLFTTEAPLGKVAVFDFDEPIALAQRIIAFHPYCSADSRFLLGVLMSPWFQETLVTKATGMTAQGIKASKLKCLSIPLAPLPEQKRIVEKVDQLMALCDELEAAQKRKREKAVAFNHADLNAVVHSSDKAALKSSWSRLEDHFEVLYELPENVSQLRQTILELAVTGKLARQRGSWNQLDAELARQREKVSLKPVDSAGCSFSSPLPASWACLRLGQLASLITKGSSPKWQGVEYLESARGGVLFITSENVGAAQLRLENKKYVQARFNEIEPRSILRKGDLLMNIVGASIGRTAIFDLEEAANINQAVCLIRLLAPGQFVVPAYMLTYLNSPPCLALMFDKQVDSARANLSMGNIAQFPVPLPPVAEQQEVVQKVSELSLLCNQLDVQLARRGEHGARLMRAVVESLVA